MKIGKTIKKVAALGAGLSFVGATMFGAMAADLSDYPSPFIKNGVFDGILVVGTGGTDPAGLASDIIGVTDLVASLQFASTTSAGPGSNTMTVTGQKWKVGTSSKVLELTEYKPIVVPETFHNITDNIGVDELDILADGSVSNNKGTYDYKQYMYFNNEATGYVELLKDNDDNVGDMLYFPTGKTMVKYELEFTTDFESDIEDADGNVDGTDSYLGDFENKIISIAGKDYTIVKARKSGTGMQLDMFGGSHKDTLDEGQTKTIIVNGKEHEVTCLAITDQGSIIAKFQIDGETTESISKGGSDKLKDGTEIGVTDIIPNEAGDVTLDMVEFYLGAQKVILKDTNVADGNTPAATNQLKVNDKTMTENDVMIVGTMDTTNAVAKIQKLVVEMGADDNYYVQPGETVSAQMSTSASLFPGSWDIMYAGLSDSATEPIEITSSGDDKYNLKFADANGNEVSVPLAYWSGSAMKLGDSDYKLVLNESSTIQKNDYLILRNKADGVAVKGNENTYALRYIGATQNTSDSRVIKFKNLGTGELIEKSYNTVAGAVGRTNDIASLTLGGQNYKIYALSAKSTSNFDIAMDLNGDDEVLQGDLVGISTDGGAGIAISKIGISTANDINISISTPDEDAFDNVNPTTLKFQIVDATTDIDLNVGNALSARSPEGDSDLSIFYTSMGARIEQRKESSGPDSLKIAYPKTQKVPLVYFTASGATVGTSTAGSENVNINRIEVGAAKLDSEVSNVEAQNVISIGGPCVNAITAELAGVAKGTCGMAGADAISLRENKAVLKLLDQTGGKVALIVAGWRAEDTRRACMVLSNYQDKELSGKIMEVSGTSMTLSEISVGAPVVEVTTTTVAPTTTLAAE